MPLNNLVQLKIKHALGIITNRIRSLTTTPKTRIRSAFSQVQDPQWWKSQKNNYLAISSVLLLLAGGTYLASTVLRSLEGGSGDVYAVNLSESRPSATFSLKPSENRFTVGRATSVAIMMDNGGAVVKTFELHLHFPPDLVKLNGINFTNSICAAITDQRLSENTGMVSITCDSINQSQTNQIGEIASIALTPLAGPAAVVNFDHSGTTITSLQGRNVLQSTQPLIMTPSEPVPANRNERVPVAIEGSSAFGCLVGSSAKAMWLKRSDAASFLYGWSDASPIKNPTVATIATSVFLPLKPNTTHFLSIRAIDDKGGAGPVTYQRVVSCP